MKGPQVHSLNAAPPLAHLLDDPVWRAEFRGLFLGEGWLGITRFRQRRNGQTAGWTYRPEMNLTQAVANKDLVYHIRDVIGGFVYERGRYVHGSDKKMRGPYYTWMSRSNGTARRGIACLTEGHMWKFDKKHDALVAFTEFLDILDEHAGRTKPQVVLDRILELRTVIHPNS